MAGLTPQRITRRRMGVLTFVVFVTATASLLMADLLWGSPLRAWSGMIWGLFTLLFGLVSFGAGACVLRFHGAPPARRATRAPSSAR